MGQENRIGGESFHLARARTFNVNKPTVGRTDTFGRATRCHLALHSFAQPRTGLGGGSCGSGSGASCDHAHRSCRAEASGHCH